MKVYTVGVFILALLLTLSFIDCSDTMELDPPSFTIEYVLEEGKVEHHIDDNVMLLSSAVDILHQDLSLIPPFKNTFYTCILHNPLLKPPTFS